MPAMMSADQVLSAEGDKNLGVTSTYALKGCSQTTSPRNNVTSALGQPCEKRLISRTHGSAAAISLICLLLGILSIMPNLKIAWRLQFSGQIVVIGFLLGIMNLCMQTVLLFSFLLFEARIGPSRLQNFEAIITGKFLSSSISFGWRLVLLLLIALPLGLSVAYKRFLGGTSSAEIMPLVQYGIDFPQLGNWAPPNDPIYFLTSSIGAFLAASQYSPRTYPGTNEFPTAYGYNTLLLSGDSAAILDTPTASYISSTQRLLSDGEALNISASVDAYMAISDTSSDFRSNDTTWNAAVNSSLNPNLGRLNTIFLYEGKRARIGMMLSGANDQAYFGIYYNSSDFGGMTTYTNPAEKDFSQFRLSARKYNLKRARCHGHWLVNASSIILVDGYCPADYTVVSSILQAPKMAPYADDALPSTQHIFGNYSRQHDPVWLNATYSVSVVTIYWARALYILGGSGSRLTTSGYSGPYPSTNQTIISTRSTLHASGLLFLVLSIQPIITFAALAVTVWLYDVPLGTGFGMISILSGFDPSRSQSIVGAGLSGKLTVPVRLEVTPTRPIQSSSPQTVAAVNHPQVAYRLLGTSKSRERKKLQKGQMYW
jgi:hypothetical protein